MTVGEYDEAVETARYVVERLDAGHPDDLGVGVVARALLELTDTEPIGSVLALRRISGETITSLDLRQAYRSNVQVKLETASGATFELYADSEIGCRIARRARG